LTTAFHFDGDGAVPSNPAAVREALQWGYRDALREHGELLESLGVSLREAAWRGDDVTLRAHVVQARLVILEALDAVRKLERVTAELPAKGRAA
jgi:hypothetical protein